MQDNIPHYIGHRQCLRQSITYSAENIADYELLELTLFFAISRKGARPLTRELIKKFGGFSNLLNSNKETLLKVK